MSEPLLPSIRAQASALARCLVVMAMASIWTSDAERRSSRRSPRAYQGREVADHAEHPVSLLDLVAARGPARSAPPGDRPNRTLELNAKLPCRRPRSSPRSR